MYSDDVWGRSGPDSVITITEPVKIKRLQCVDEIKRAIEIAEVQVVRDADGRRTITPVGESLELPCDLALLAIGFEGVEQMRLLDGLGLDLNRRGALGCGPDWQTTTPGVFVCGDAHRGASLIVWAIAEGRSAAHAVDAYLMGESDLPAPVRPSALPLAVV